jgi:hypothetical protein
MFKLFTPVVLIVFNRPETTKKVFEQIRKAKPAELFIIADGARSNVAGEEKLCKEVKSIVENVDWECAVYKDYANENLGCKVRVSSGLKWVFQHTDRAIILEDDCLPHPSFFRFCQELLRFYKDDEEVNLIAGSNFISSYSNKNYSYYFSVFHHFWGWATWKRSWELFNLEMGDWQELKRNKQLSQIIPDNKSAKYWETIFDEVYTGKISSSWAYHWYYSSWQNKKLAVVPSVNLVSNIGFGQHATHTKKLKNIRANIPLEDIHFPLIHPPEVKSDVKSDMIEAKKIFRFKGKEKIIRLVKKIIPKT